MVSSLIVRKGADRRVIKCNNYHTLYQAEPHLCDRLNHFGSI
nr:MAG TPA: hypothetical protein [Caudoviricetes sp.]DAQ05646.1 MAG TPA: hypothetical protein [Caudoviricetes sp.]